MQSSAVQCSAVYSAVVYTVQCCIQCSAVYSAVQYHLQFSAIVFKVHSNAVYIAVQCIIKVYIKIHLSWVEVEPWMGGVCCPRR